MRRKNTGIDFEKIVADIQTRIDPNANVEHDEIIVDRLGHRRQFDVVIRGTFAGQEILGVVECKDLNKKVGTPEIDGFVTKSQDINANFKIIVSRKGFSKPAIEKSKHYGIQTLSLLPQDEVNHGFKVGNFWYADVYYWEQMSLKLLFSPGLEKQLNFNAQDVMIHGKRVVDWFSNYLLAKHDCEEQLGWVVGVALNFDREQSVQVSAQEILVCKGLEFHAKRSIAKKQKFVGINGTGFFDWQNSRATIPPQDTIKSDIVDANFMDWDDRDENNIEEAGFMTFNIVGHNSQLELVVDAIDLENL